MPNPREFAEIVGRIVNAGGGVVLIGGHLDDIGAVTFPGVAPLTPVELEAFESAPVIGLDPSLHGVRLRYLPMAYGMVFVAFVPTSDSGPHLIAEGRGMRLPLRDGISDFDGSEAHLRSHYLSGSHPKGVAWRGADHRLRAFDEAGVIIDLRAWPRLEPSSPASLSKAEVLDLVERAADRVDELLPHPRRAHFAV
ncbi:hypothetical protein C8046_14070 [Serinibacter arcticus]|uniref:Schlafen AlbA-2 domain-containing protein n=1 Tax=Serinibacter arcticus TaxID=1655435 RepID=A0A2U1ZXF2_9MICO|nr:hypothetical protein C8046_14070 [Serinibacter arcticus]